jgi:hypothetical protein
MLHRVHTLKVECAGHLFQFREWLIYAQGMGLLRMRVAHYCQLAHLLLTAMFPELYFDPTDKARVSDADQRDVWSANLFGR